MTPRLRRAVGLLLLLIPTLVLADSDRPLSVDDVLRLHFAGVSEDIILSEIIVTESAFTLDVDDILRLQEAGISERLLQFLVDTGRDPDPAEAEEEFTEEPTDGEVYADQDAESDTEIWANEIQQLEPTTTYRVSLNYSYPSWWYDTYWWDYWYYDFDYYPYQSSFVVDVGAWYPGWYGYRHCWSPPYWGYRAYWCAGAGYSWYGSVYYGYYEPYHYYSGYDSGYDDGYDHALSTTKTKGGSWSGPPLYADAGLKVPDAGRLPIRDVKVRDRARDDRPKDGRLVVSERPELPDRKDPGRRPTKALTTADLSDHRGKGRTVDRSGEVDDKPRKTVRTPVRDVRSPASGGRPVKVKTLTSPSGTEKEPPARVDPPPSKPTRRVESTAPEPPRERPPGVKSPPPPKRTPTRDVKPAPRPSPRPKVSSPPPAPRKPSGAGVSPRPSRAPTKSPPARGSRTPARPKPRGRR